MALPDLHARIMQVASELPEARTLALAGGEAMLAHGIVERETKDVDLFTDRDADEAVRIAGALRSALLAAGLEVAPSRDRRTRIGVALAANLLACFRHLALPAGQLRDAAPKLLRYRLWHLPARLTRGHRKRWLHLRADWPWTEDVINTWQAVRALAAPT